MPTITKEIISIPTVKVFAMTDEGNHPFILSFHTNDFDYGDIYFRVTPNRTNPVTKIPVYAGICHSTSSFMDMLIAYGCHYIKRLPISKGEILSRDYLDGLADGIIIPNPKTRCCCNCNCNDESSEESSADFLDRLIASLEELEELDEDELPF